VRRMFPGIVVTAAGALVLATVGSGTPVGAGGGPLYVAGAGVEVVEVLAVGGAGGSTNQFSLYDGGTGCQVVASIPVAEGDIFNFTPGGAGGSTTAVSVDTPGGGGGSGSRPGGAGGAITQPFNAAAPGAGGGGATSVSLNGTEIIVAAGGGGASAPTSGGSACANNTPEGSSGFGTFPTAGGGIVPEVGGIAGLGNGGSSNPPPGASGNSATGSIPGKGGDGGGGNFGGPGGGGGGGGISGGGGGAGQNGQFGGGIGTGAAGLSGAPAPGVGIALPSFAPGSANDSGLVAVYEVVIDTTSLPGATQGTAYSANLEAAFEEVAANTPSGPGPVAIEEVVWELAEGSDPLPAGLSLTPQGSISGTPSTTGTSELSLAAEVLNGGDVRARTVTSITIDVAAATPTTEPSPTPPTSVDPTTPTTAAGGGGTLPATGVSGVAPLVAAGVVLIGSGAGVGLLSRRRRRD